MKSQTALPVLFLFIFVFLFASVTKCQDTENKQEKRIEASTKVLKDFSEMKENIPQELLKVTQRIIELIDAGFVLCR